MNGKTSVASVLIAMMVALLVVMSAYNSYQIGEVRQGIERQVKQSEARVQVKEWVGKIRSQSKDPAIHHDKSDMAADFSASGTIDESDPWGHFLKFYYGCDVPGTMYYLVRSAGPDGEYDTRDDVLECGSSGYDAGY